jgi:hypothetical protein
MKNTLLSIALTIGVGLMALLPAKSEAQSGIAGGYPVFQGQFIHQGPLADNFSNATLNGNTVINGPYTNSAPISRVANPVTTGGAYTTPSVQGFLTFNLLCTNTATAYITNYTTTQAYFVGAVTGNGTNYSTVTIRTGPGDVVLLTNTVGTPNLVSSEWRN